MRERTQRVVITFHTTAGAIAMEKQCKESGIAGRLIPVPRQVSAGCGIAWSAPAEEQEEIKMFIYEQKIDIDNIYECLL